MTHSYSELAGKPRQLVAPKQVTKLPLAYFRYGGPHRKRDCPLVVGTQTPPGETEATGKWRKSGHSLNRNCCSGQKKTNIQFNGPIDRNVQLDGPIGQKGLIGWSDWLKCLVRWSERTECLIE